MRSSHIDDILEKGGEGSGVKGHRGYHENERSHHYEESLKIQDALQKVNEAVKKRKAVNPKYQIPEEAKEIIKELKGRLDGHKAQLANHVNQVGRLDAADAKKMAVKKSVIASDPYSGTAIDTGAYSQAANAAVDWMSKFTECMDGFGYGDVPRDISLDKGYYVSLVKTDDGIYSGRVRQTIQPGQNEELEENVFRIEKQTIPDIIQMLKAKEYIGLPIQTVDVVAPVEAPQPEEPMVTLTEYLKIMEERDLRDMRMKLEVIRTLINV